MTAPVTAPIDSDSTRQALAQRLRAAAAVLVDGDLPAEHPDAARDAAVVLDLLVRWVHEQPTADGIWLLVTAISSCLPTSDDVQAAVRQFELSSVSAVTVWLLDVCMTMAQAGSPTREMIVTGQVVVDVDHSARFDLHTGIQQVVRNTIPLWAADHDITLVAWTGGTAQRALSKTERERVLRPGTTDRPAIVAGAAQPAPESEPEPEPAAELLVVPWRTTVVLAEVPPESAAQRLAALAQFSGNRLAAIGYDCIPIVSADMVPIEEPNRFVRYLSAIKYAHRVAAISISATVEFRGFAAALPTQGLPGPAVVECLLPSEGIARLPQENNEPGALPEVVAIGSFEPRKNHLALLYAAERLWREGEHFRLRLIGGSGWGEEIPQRVRQLQGQGRPLTIERGVSTDELTLALQNARFSVFASLHEGYGLPVAESIALGTPVITTGYGSTKEIGDGRGALLIDPRDDEALVGAMRLLLRDDERLATLRRDTARRSSRSWSDYAREAWVHLVDTDTDTDTAGSSVPGSFGRSNPAVGAGRA
jgi:glycosyltransferase involved in cell wall biosynthesis